MGKPEFKPGDLVRFKGRGLGPGKITTITLQKRKNSISYLIYHVTLLKKDLLIACFEEQIEKLSPEDEDLINALDSIGNF